MSAHTLPSIRRQLLIRRVLLVLIVFVSAVAWISLVTVAALLALRPAGPWSPMVRIGLMLWVSSTLVLPLAPLGLAVFLDSPRRRELRALAAGRSADRTPAQRGLRIGLVFGLMIAVAMGSAGLLLASIPMAVLAVSAALLVGISVLLPPAVASRALRGALKAGRLDEARTLLERHRHWMPAGTYLMSRAVVAFQSGHPAEAEPLVQAWLGTFGQGPAAAQAVALLAWVRIERGDDAGASAALELLDRIQPAASATLVLHGLRDLRAGRADAETVARLELAVDVATRSPVQRTNLGLAQATLGWACAATGDVARARQALEDLEITPRTDPLGAARAHLHAAIAHELLGEPAQALAHHGAIAAVAPEGDVLRQARTARERLRAHTDDHG